MQQNPARDSQSVLLAILGLRSREASGLYAVELLRAYGCRTISDAHLHHAFLPVDATEGGVRLAHVLEGGVRGAVGEGAQPVAVVHHALRLVSGAPRCGLPCSSISLTARRSSATRTTFWWLLRGDTYADNAASLLEPAICDVKTRIQRMQYSCLTGRKGNIAKQGSVLNGLATPVANTIKSGSQCAHCTPAS